MQLRCKLVYCCVVRFLQKMKITKSGNNTYFAKKNIYTFNVILCVLVIICITAFSKSRTSDCINLNSAAIQQNNRKYKYPKCMIEQGLTYKISWKEK